MRTGQCNLLRGLACALALPLLAGAVAAAEFAAISQPIPPKEKPAARSVVVRTSGEMSAPDTPDPGDDGLCPEGRMAVGDLGIRSLEFEGTMRSREDGSWSMAFRSEPKVVDVDPSGPADGKLRAGDVIVAIGGKLITTSSGGRLYSDPPIGEPIELTVRRGGSTHTVTITPAAACPDPARGWPFALPDAPAPPAAPGPGALTPAPLAPEPGPPGAVAPPTAPRAPRTPRAPRADDLAASELERAQREYDRASERLAARQSDEARRAAELAARDFERAKREHQRIAELAEREAERAAREYERAVARAWVQNYPDAWTGLGLSADRIDVRMWDDGSGEYVTFGSPPRIVSVDDESPAARAKLKRGDVWLSLDGVDLTTDEGARRLARLKPGQAVEVAAQRGKERIVVQLVPEHHAPIAPRAEGREVGPPVYLLRYSGDVGGASVEVHSRRHAKVGVEERPGEIVIETGDASVRIWLGRNDDE